MDFITQKVGPQEFPPTPSEDRSKLCNFSERGYYDLTPPGEIYDAEDANLISLGSIDVVTEPLVAVIGVGYVGEHLVSVFSNCYNVLGYDVSEARAKHLTEIFEGKDRVRITSKTTDIAEATHFLISVPTLLLPDKTIDSSFLRSALTTVGFTPVGVQSLSLRAQSPWA